MTTSFPIEGRIARLEGSFEQIERRLGTLEQDLRSLRAEISAGFDRLGTGLTGWKPELSRWTLGLTPGLTA